MTSFQNEEDNLNTIYSDNGDGTFMMLMYFYSGADLLWIETPIPNLKKIASLVAAIRAQVRDFEKYIFPI